MKQYLDGLQRIMDHGVDRMDRTGVGTRAVFGEQIRYDLKQGFPIVTTKKLAWKIAFGELLWMISGSGDERKLAEITFGTRDLSKNTIWTANAMADYWLPKAKFERDLGRVYGVQWRGWQTPSGRVVDQLEELIEGIKTNPYSRRHILSAWNPGELDQMALPPCHMMAQFYVANGELSCQMMQRSGDAFLGTTMNIVNYSLLTHMIAQICNLGVGEFIHTIGDHHIYFNHFDAVKVQLSRTPLALPTLALNPDIKDINKFTLDDIKLENYISHPPIKAPMAV